MKRPEGFDPERAPAPHRSRAALLDQPADTPVKPEKPEKAGKAAKASRSVKARVSKAERALRGSRPADAQAELRAARRARLQAERAEIKRFTRTARRRRTGWLIALGVAATVALVVAGAVFSPALALRSIEIDGTERLDQAEIAAALEGELGLPLALVDEARIADELSGFALIRNFVVELVPPSTMRVVIEEREPIGVVVSGPVFQFVDPAGIVVETSETRPDGVPLLELPVGDDGTVRRAVAEVLLALPDEVLAQVDRITATTRDDVTFSLRDSSQRVVWGSAENPERKALVLEALLGKWRNKGPGEYDVSGFGSATFREL